ncbi:aldehyde dehydrogenase (NAD+)/phenylacetaldehyde dehydrogenase [Sinosporangium album]|uniref:Aldehyde dehydrogenase (NAD+)/phenylacetaldehyde dehydrogenase n=1 Tax=Sinosporangium album TaxID=504805 RepID=A0A1G7QUE4_9ACTN|nr:aldehyde dehydrogenase family protein [Sinosporangium album]SDG01290.1 aldehyde dehydrogenase (NAD+)/phenylacetaldehyde dehydrogenase [Sinosporangium album]
MTTPPGLAVDFLAWSHPLFIDGEFADALDGKTFETIDPGTGKVLSTVAEASERDVDRAVAAARRATEGPWSVMSPSERGRIVHRIGDLIAEHAEELAELESLDTGKPAGAALTVEIPLAADMFWYMAGAARRIKRSGWGREKGDAVLEQYLETKSVVVAL